MYKNLIAIVLLGALTACTTTETVTTNRATISDPAWPAPVQTRQIKKQVAKLPSGQIIVGYSYEDDKEMEMYNEDVLRYVKDLKAMTCFYRAPLKEKVCENSEINKKPANEKPAK